MTGAFTPRLPFDQVPPGLHAALEAAVGARVVGTESVHGGMSPGPAALLTLTDGRQVFAKTVAASMSPSAHEFHRRELEVLRMLPGSVPHAPLVAGFEHDGWVTIVTEAADGTAVGPPWRSQHLASVADAVATCAGHVGIEGLAPAVERLPPLDGWRDLVHDRPDELDDWERAHIESLVAMSDGWSIWTTGPHLVHLDVRCDNAVPHGEDVWLVDWASACHGAAWVDAASLALDVVASGHVGGPQVALSTARGMLARLPYEATRFVVAVTGMFRFYALKPERPGQPTFRDWQRRRSAALRPLVERLVSR
ncbi:hypothetical protein GCM10027053_38700 [Intrasporangium mesophilum]